MSVVWSGWDPTVVDRSGQMTVRFPLALENGKPIYNKPDAERAWGKLVALYKAALA